MNNNLIHLDFHVGRNQLALFAEVLNNCGYSLYVPGSAPERVFAIVTKTREVTLSDLAFLPNTRFIIVVGSDDWMISYDKQESDYTIITIDIDRGFEVAEHAIALLLLGLKNLNRIHRIKDALNFRSIRALMSPTLATETTGSPGWRGLQTRTIYGKNLGIIGYGLIGREIHKRLLGFHPGSIFYHNRRKYSAKVEQRINSSYLSLEEMFSTCEAIFLQLPYKDDTVNIIDKRVLNHAKPGSIIINCGRAGTVNKDDLYDLLKSRPDVFYAADVFWKEPLPLFDRYRRLENCFITPHMAESLSEIDHSKTLWSSKLISTIKTLSGGVP